MKIKEQLQLVIENAEYEEYPHSAIYKLDYNKAIDGCFEVTKDIAIKFANWIDKMTRTSKIINKQNGSFYYNERYYIIDELFEEFLKIL